MPQRPYTSNAHMNTNAPANTNKNTGQNEKIIYL